MERKKKEAEDAEAAIRELEEYDEQK